MSQMGIYIIHDDDTQRAPTNRKYNAQELVLTYALYIQIFRHLFDFILFYFSVSFFFSLLNFNTVTEMSCKCRMAADTRGSHFPHSASVD
jgi:hypothetical protein